MSEIKFRLLITLLLVIWLSLGMFLIIFWSELPAYISWPLSIFEFLICAVEKNDRNSAQFEHAQ